MGRVAVIKSNYTPYGGGEKYARAVINAFLEKGYEVDVITASEEDWTENGVNKIKISMARYNNFLRLYSFNKNCYEFLNKNFNRYKVILDLDRTTLATHIRAGGGSHKGWLERRSKFSSFFKNLSFKINPFHNYMLKIEKKSLENPCLRALICNSYMVKDEFINYYGVDSNKVHVVHNGVEWKNFEKPFSESMEKRREIKKVLGLDDRFWLLYVGSGYERKGLAFIINALSLIKKDYCLAVVGKDRNENYYKNMAEEKRLSNRIKFFGPRQDVIKFLQCADAFILPTIYDPFSNATLEALAMGLFTITSNSNGCSEILKDGCGYIIKDLKNTEEMVHAIELTSKDYDRIYIRESVKEYDFNIKLNELVELCINTGRSLT